MNIRVADIQAVYEEWSARGADFITPPITHVFASLTIVGRCLSAVRRGVGDALPFSPSLERLARMTMASPVAYGTVLTALPCTD